jgi:hypothetical protein
MKSFETEIKKYAEKTRLKALEREAIRDRLLTYMEYHPLKKDHADLLSLSSLRSGSVYVSFNSFWMRSVSGALAILLVIAVPLLAERAVPGDVLYLVKTEVNEGIRTQLASSPYEKVALETRLIERRIAEARLLASEGKLTGEVEAQIAETVKGHAQAVQSGLAELRVNDADGAALAEISFNSTLEIQSAVLDHSEESGSSSVASILNVVNTVRDEVAADANPMTPSYEGLLARIESETTRAYEFFATVKESATAEEISDMERRLSDINRSIVEAKELQVTNETEAVTKMIETLGLIQKLITFMTDIDVRETVTLESIVPLSLTDEERIFNLEEIRADVEESVRVIENKVDYIEDEGIKEKVIMGLDDVEVLVSDLTEAIGAHEVQMAEQYAAEAQALAGDLTNLTEGITALEEAEIPNAGEATTTTPVSEEVTPDSPETSEEATSSVSE